MALIRNSNRTAFDRKVCTTPIYKKVFSAIQRMHRRHGVIREPGALGIFGRSGAGKSTLVENYRDQHPAHFVDTEKGRQRRIPVLLVEVPEACTMRKFSEAVCIELGVSVPTSDNATHLKHKLLEGLKHSGTELLIIDEAQEFLTNSSPSGAKTVRHFLRHLLDAAKIPVVFIGTPEYREFIHADEPIRRRVKQQISLDLFEAPVAEKSMFHFTILAMLKHLEETCSRRLERGVDTLEFAQRLYLMSGGRMGPVKAFFDQYIEDEIEERSSKSTFGPNEWRRTMEHYSSPFAFETSKPAFELRSTSLKRLLEDKYPTPEVIA